jgi:hypothetical protein
VTKLISLAAALLTLSPLAYLPSCKPRGSSAEA